MTASKRSRTRVPAAAATAGSGLGKVREYQNAHGYEPLLMLEKLYGQPPGRAELQGSARTPLSGASSGYGTRTRRPSPGGGGGGGSSVLTVDWS
jgi:hypothetical protein